MRALPWLNLGLFALVVAVNANHHAYSPPTWPNSTPDLPIAPAAYAYAVWLVVYLFTAAHLFTDCAFPQHSIYTEAEKPTFLRVCFALSCGFNAGWAMLTNWLQWMNLATVVLFFLMMSLLPIYLFLSRESVEGVTPPSWKRYFASAVAIRLYFSWVCVATVLCFAASLQDILGAYLSFSTYVMLLAYLLVLALTGVVYGNDPVFGLVAIWTLFGVVNKQNPENTLNHHTVDMIQAAAALGSPLMLGMIIISVIRWSLTERPVRYSEVLKPLSSFEDGLLYGTNDKMEGSWLAFLNAALLVVQAGVNIAYLGKANHLAREYETLITPASFAFAIWVVIYALELGLVGMDLFHPQSSFYADATQPSQLRGCFALTCIFNTLWLVLFVKHHLVGATVMMFLLWLALLVLYVYSVNDRNNRAGFEWKLYIFNELPIAMYFGWVTALAFTHLAIALQESHHGFLMISTYVTHLSIVAVFALLAILYAQDAIFGLVAIWYFLAVSTKHVTLPSNVMAADMAVRACAGEAAGIISAILIISFLSMFMMDSKARGEEEIVAGMPVVQGTNYGTNA
ncbi:hypothetical protein Poli38472_006802 [Pythium oligandrum]|uniref:Uncharacterized protein n=1 Tax=Pythium oligandrum TaxID=41045 RepID=A0A8K1FEM1_PYTOL|nr:hypothetical protein Poli38472_006802 [Pythium oligandrum]|eukprot:TMW56792.1 hypothetical protein Poli38472_006802 [Pythium oligandrum]